MKAKTIKKILPALLVVGLCTGISGAIFAEGGHGETEIRHAEVQTADHERYEHHQSESGHGKEVTVAVHDDAPNAHHGAEAAHDEGHGDGHAAPMITKKKILDLLWRTLNFAALLFLLVKFAGKPIVGFLSGRRREIKEDLAGLQNRRDEAERSYKEFEARLAGVEDEMKLIVSRAVALAEDEKSRILTEAEDTAREIKRQAEAAVQAAMTDVRNKLQKEAVEQAVVLAEELIIKNLTPKDQVVLIEQYLERTESVQ